MEKISTDKKMQIIKDLIENYVRKDVKPTYSALAKSYGISKTSLRRLEEAARKYWNYYELFHLRGGYLSSLKRKYPEFRGITDVPNHFNDSSGRPTITSSLYIDLKDLLLNEKSYCIPWVTHLLELLFWSVYGERKKLDSESVKHAIEMDYQQAFPKNLYHDFQQCDFSGHHKHLPPFINYKWWNTEDDTKLPHSAAHYFYIKVSGDLISAVDDSQMVYFAFIDKNKDIIDRLEVFMKSYVDNVVQYATELTTEDSEIRHSFDYTFAFSHLLSVDGYGNYIYVTPLSDRDLYVRKERGFITEDYRPGLIKLPT